MHPIHRLAFVVVATFIWTHVTFALAQSEQYPLAPPDQSSPRAALTTFMGVMNAVYHRWKTEGRIYQNRAQLAAAARLGPRFFDLDDVAPSVRINVGRETAMFIKEVLDRVGLPPWEEIPDQAMIAAKPGGLNQWTIPHTEITLVRLKEGLREGQWVFSSETHKRAAEFYERVKHLPYLPGSTVGLYDLFVSEPGWLIPQSFVHALPGWMKARCGDQVVWQWCALVLTLVLMVALMVLIYRVGQRWSRRQHGTRYYLAVVFPLLAVIVPQSATTFLSDQVFITGPLLANIDFALDIVSLSALVVLIVAVTNRLANALMALPWFKPGQLNAQLAQLIVRALGVAAAVVAVFEGGRYIGVPLTTLIAGVSVSGLTVALAAQDTLKNLFGSLMILLDRPFQVGDSIRVKGHEGTVESVGLRSTRIRDSSGHVVSIPNDEMARLDSKKMSQQRYLQRKEVLRLRADTPPARIRNFASLVSGILENHEGCDPAHPPSVRIGLGDDAVLVTINYSYHPPNAASFAAFNEKVTLQILEGMAKEGVQLAQASNN